jgi:MarR family transcriptional regulator, organic hydroperoxide resistance regulator
MPRPSIKLAQAVIDQFWEVIPPTWNQVRGRVRATATEEFGITLEQFHILRHVNKGHQSVSELADVKQISRPAISQAVEALVGRGLISRKQSVTDRRWVELELTESGKELLTVVFQKNRRWMESRLTAFSKEELKELTRGMELLHKAFYEEAE